MWILSVDTAGQAGSVALTCAGEVKGLVETDFTESHSVRLFAAVAFLVHQLKKPLSEMDAFAVTIGPGSFAGLRIGVAAIKGFSEMHHKPCVAVSTLEAIAASAVEIPPGVKVVSLMDARREELYAGIYKSTGNALVCLEPDRLLGVEAFFESLEDAPCHFVGPEVEKFSRFIQGPERTSWTMETTGPFLAPTVARLAERKLQGREIHSADAISIHYLRRSGAEMMFKG